MDNPPPEGSGSGRLPTQVEAVDVHSDDSMDADAVAPRKKAPLRPALFDTDDEDDDLPVVTVVKTVSKGKGKKKKASIPPPADKDDHDDDEDDDEDNEDTTPVPPTKRSKRIKWYLSREESDIFVEFVRNNEVMVDSKHEQYKKPNLVQMLW
ncbi:MAG: hypothetical protein GY697_13780, partial [Desulfobacterales bacterium]|nr:hypothetical protein [Desulfobacterales bacterium]